MAPTSATAIMVDSGLYFDAKNPRAADVVLDDIAHSSGQTVRHNGHLCRPITTAEHMARVGRIAAVIAPPPFKREARFLGHLHDAHEAYTPWGDRPGKTDEMREVEAKIDEAIFRRLTGRNWEPSSEARAAVKEADNIALYFETMIWQRHGDDWAPSLLKPGTPLAGLLSLLPLVAPLRGETLTEALVSNTWVGAAWLRELWRIWPSSLRPDSGEWARSTYISWEGARVGERDEP